MTQARTIQNRTEPSRALRTCHIHAKVVTSILKWQESSRTCHYHRPASKSRKIATNQSTGQATIYHFNISQARTIYNRTKPSRALRTCHIHARVAKTILKRQESSRTSHNNHAVSKSRQISKNQSTGHARIYHYNIKQAKTIQHCKDTLRTNATCHNYEKLATTVRNWQEYCKTGNNHKAASKSRKISKNQSTGQAKVYHYNKNRKRPSNTVQNLQEPNSTCHNSAKLATSILKWQETCRTCHNHRPASKSRKISKNQSTGQARIYHYNIKQAKTIQHRTEPSRALRTCHINARVATTILNCQETSRTGHNHHAVSKSRKISKNQSTGQARIYHYNRK